MERKQYAHKVVLKVIEFVAQASHSLFPDEETAKAAFDEIPEELQEHIMVCILAAREVKKRSIFQALSDAIGDK